MGTAQSSASSPSDVSNDAKSPAPTQSRTDAAVGLNQAVVIGELVADPEFRELPSGSVAASFSLTVRSPGIKTTSVPVVWYDPGKRLSSWQSGDVAIVRGSVVRRFFQSAGGLGSSTEVVAADAELVRHRAKLERVLQRGRHSLDEATTNN